MKKTLALCVLFALLTTPVLSADQKKEKKEEPWSKVRIVHEMEWVQDCEFMAEVVGTSFWGTSKNRNEKRARNRMKQEAYEMGADTILWEYGRDQQDAFTKTKVRGEAFLCNAKEDTPAPAPTETQAPPPPRSREVRDARERYRDRGGLSDNPRPLGCDGDLYRDDERMWRWRERRPRSDGSSDHGTRLP